MQRDVLRHRPARSTTVLPGNWLINLPADTSIHVRRYRSAAPSPKTREEDLVNDPLDTYWRGANSTGNGNMKDILEGACALITSGAKGSDIEGGREIWIFNTTGAFFENPTGLDLSPTQYDPIQPVRLLHCPRHGHDISCLSRPSTSQRPLKSCEVRFQIHGGDKEVWENFGRAIVEKAEWKRGRRFVAQGSGLHIQLLPDLNGLSLKIQPGKRAGISRPAGSMSSAKVRIIRPLGLPAILIGPYRPSTEDTAALPSSYESTLGTNWKEGQSACRLEAQLSGRAYWDYSTLWIPESAISEYPKSRQDDSFNWKKGKGILTIWPTHLLQAVTESSSDPPVSTKGLRDAPAFISSMELMSIASGLFDAISTYREPVEQLTPPDDAYTEEEIPVAVEPPGLSPAAQDTWDHDAQQDHDDLEELFASPQSSHPSNERLHFEMFGEQEYRRASTTDNADLIDYNDVIMSSPPAQDRLELEPRQTLREVMGDEGDEAGPGLVTDDDFNFFDSPAEAAPTVEADPTEGVDVPPPTPESVFNVNAVEAPPPIAEVEEPVSDIPSFQEPESTEVSPEMHISPGSPLPAVSPPVPRSTTDPLPVLNRPRTRGQDLVPEDFAPLALATSRDIFRYALPTPANSPPDLNVELVERLRLPNKKGKAYDYSLTWHLDVSDTESESDDYTRPPTPMSEPDDLFPSRTSSPEAIRRDDKSNTLSRYMYQGNVCMAAGLQAMLGGRIQSGDMGVPWDPSWAEEEANPTLDSPVVNLANKRKQAESNATDSNSLSAFARRIIENRHARQMPRLTSPFESSHDTTLTEEGVTLGDLAVSNDSTSNGVLARAQSTLSACTIHTGYQGRVIQLSIAALRYWSELGLQPLSGPKKIKAVIVTKHKGDVNRARRLLESLSATYSALNLGEIEVDLSYGRQGLQCYEAEVSIAPWSRDSSENSVMFGMVRESAGAAMPLLRISAQTKPNQAVHVLPLSLAPRDLADAAIEIYNSISRQVHLVHPAEEPAPWHNYPSFTLAPPTRPKPQMTLHWPLKSFDVLSAWRSLHAAYSFDESSGCLSMFVADLEGDDWAVRVENCPGSEWRTRAKFIWDFVTTFADSAAVEWHVTICSLGLMIPGELKAWRDTFVARAEPMSIVMCDTSPPVGHKARPTPGPPNVQQSVLNDSSTITLDESLAGTYVPLAQRQPIPVGDTIIYSASTFLMSLAASNLSYDTSIYHCMYNRPVPGREEEDSDRELANELYRLACWGRMRFGLERLPASLAAVAVLNEALAAAGVTGT